LAQVNDQGGLGALRIVSAGPLGQSLVRSRGPRSACGGTWDQVVASVSLVPVAANHVPFAEHAQSIYGEDPVRDSPLG